jgi:hypothetical protein
MTPKSALIVGVATVAVAIGAPSALAKGQPLVPESPAMKALQIRSIALNEKYGLGDFAPIVSNGSAARQRAIQLRSEALNKKYGLGEFARSVPAESARFRAIQIRSEALNQQYGLGETTSSSGTESGWRQVGIGVAIAFLLVGGLAVALRVTRVRTLAH